MILLNQTVPWCLMLSKVIFNIFNIECNVIQNSHQETFLAPFLDMFMPHSQYFQSTLWNVPHSSWLAMPFQHILCFASAHIFMNIQLKFEQSMKRFPQFLMYFNILYMLWTIYLDRCWIENVVKIPYSVNTFWVPRMWQELF